MTPPEDAAGVHETMLTSLRQVTAKLREVVDALRRRDPSAEQLLEDADLLGQASDEAALAYGFKVCGSEEEIAEERSASNS